MMFAFDDNSLLSDQDTNQSCYMFILYKYNLMTEYIYIYIYIYIFGHRLGLKFIEI